MNGGFSLGQFGPCFKAFANGKISAAKIIQTMNRKPLISTKENAIKLPSLKGDIVLTDVEFSYPNRAEVQVLK